MKKYTVMDVDLKCKISRNLTRLPVGIKNSLLYHVQIKFDLSDSRDLFSRPDVGVYARLDAQVKSLILL